MRIDTSKISKTTLIGILHLAIVGIIAAVALPAGAKFGAIALAVLHAWVSYLQKDAGMQDALLPGSNEPTSVPSHETPDDPNDVPVVK